MGLLAIQKEELTMSGDLCFVIRICVLSAKKGIARPSLRLHLVLMSAERDDNDILAGGRSRRFALILGGKC